MRITRAQFDGLAMEHIDMLYRIARRLTREPVQAEDLVQETYLRAFRAWNEFELKEHGIRPWLVRIMNNLFLTRAQREKSQPMSISDVKGEIAAPETLQTLGKNAAFQAMDQKLVRAIEELPAEYQTTLVLWAVEDFSYKEIAAATDVPIGTVMSRLHRARARLSDRLSGFAREHRIIRE
jgi:RNA polymerase sigma-70 factor (ECF subfamily)